MKSAICLSALLAVGFFCQCSVSWAQAGNAGHPTSSTSPSPSPIKPARAVAHPSPRRTRSSFPGPCDLSCAWPVSVSRYLADDVLPLLARNAYATGYLNGVPTEYLRLVDRYLHQARELQMLAGSSGTIHVANCAEAEPLLSILGYHARPACGQKGSTLMTADPERAFLTTDSGFPLTALEEALEKGKPFTYAFPSPAFPCFSAKTSGGRSAAPRAEARNRWWTSCCTSRQSTGSTGRLPIPMPKPGMRSHARLAWGDFCPTARFLISMERRSAFAAAG